MKNYALIVTVVFFTANTSYADNAVKLNSSDASMKFLSDVKSQIKPQTADDTKKIAMLTGDTRSSSPTSLVNAFEINADTDTSSANIKITPVTSKYNFSLLLSTPLDKDTKEGKFYDTNAFTKSSYAEISAQYVFLTKNDSERIQQMDNADLLIGFCKENPDYFNYKKASDCEGTQKIDDLIEIYKSKKLVANPIVDYWDKQLKSPIILLSSSLKLGRESYDYLSGLDKKSINKKPWGGGVNLTYLKPEAYMISAGYEYQEGYNAQKSGVVCPVVTSGSFVNCVQGAKGAPQENINHIVSVEYKQPIIFYNIPFLKNIPLAFAPKVLRDLEDDVTAISIPVYFFQDEKGGLTGGLSSNWNSKDEDWKFGVFIGSKFDLGL